MNMIEDNNVFNIEDAQDIGNNGQDNSLRSRLSFLNYDNGMEYCGDDEEFYMDILRSYLEDNVLTILNDLYMKSDWRTYKVRVHGLKSSSRYVGADDISEKARQLEFAARDNDITFINMNHYKFMWQYEVLLKKINSVFINSEYHEDVANLGQLDVMVVDDNELVGEIIRNVVSEYYHVTVCHSGEEALEKLNTMSPDVILLDINMPPGMNGYEVMRKLRESERLSVIPVIVMTSDNHVEMEARGFEEGAFDFVSKNASREVLVARINRIVELEYLRKFLYSEIRKRTKAEQENRMKAEKLAEEIVLALTNAIDAKDKFTKGHSDRVAKYSIMIAKELGYDADQLRRLKYAALLHDIGKIGVPDEVICKPGRLSEAEFAIVKSHTVIGANILSSITTIEDIAVAAKHHHERYDGKGYPDGLSGLHIPEFARIICVADAYDAMTSRRGFRCDMKQEEVREQIAKELGGQFDPMFGQTMLELIDRDTGYTMREDDSELPQGVDIHGNAIEPYKGSVMI